MIKKFNHEADSIHEALGYPSQRKFMQWLKSTFTGIDFGDPQGLTDNQMLAVAVTITKNLSDFLTVTDAERIEPIINMAAKSQIIEILYETMKEDPVFRAYALGFLATRMNCPKFLVQDLFEK